MEYFLTNKLYYVTIISTAIGMQSNLSASYNFVLKEHAYI